MTILGLDIGGANIKAANDAGLAVSRPFAIWHQRDRLKDEIAAILHQFPQTDCVAVTMTAELADCFSTKSEGVHFILAAVEESVREGLVGLKDPVVVWTTDGKFVPANQARAIVMQVAAANWHALATWCGKLVPEGPSLLIDIGTTTTDIIPLMNGTPIPVGLTDVNRLKTGELCYTGVWRTPLCAVAHSVPFRDGYCSLAAELFATTLDVHLLLGQIAEDEQNFDSSNGKPATKAAAHDRIARMLCGDRDEISFDEAVQIAKFLADVQRQRLAGALERVVHRLPEPCQNVIVSGSGTFLARQLAYENRRTTTSKVHSLSDQISPGIAEAACAYAVAQLAKLAR